MGINVRTKGKVGERDVANRLNTALFNGDKRFRRTMFALDGLMFDVVANGVPWAIEVKNCKNSAIPSWWRQACSQTTDTHSRPILFYKRPRQQWQVLLGDVFHSGHNVPAAMDFDAFCAWAVKELGL